MAQSPIGGTQNQISIGNVAQVGGTTVPGAQLPLQPFNAQAPSYRINQAAYAAYATPTDMVSITGSATKKVRINVALLALHSTAASLQNLYFRRRTTLNTGGTPTVLTAVAPDSSSAAPTAVVTMYGSAPTTGTDGGLLALITTTTTVLTATPQLFSASQFFGAPAATSFPNSIVLNGANESLVFNWAGAAIPAGFDATIILEWSEF